VVKVFKTSYHGKEQILGIAYPGEALNDVSTFDDAPNYASGQAMTQVLLYSIRKKDMKEILGKYPEVALKAIYGVSIRARQAWALVEDLSFSQVTGRLAKMLLRQEEDKDFLPRITQQDMAAMISTSRVVVNRSLRIMEEEGAIRLSRHGMLINKKEILQRTAKSL
jgi:CRP/FNR family transcriptional regulator